jgi:hypothetical protein
MNTDPQHAAPPAPRPARVRALLGAVSCALALVILAPVLLSSQDLYAWGRAGLGLPAGWAWLVPVALDAAASVCIGLTIAAAWRRERPGLFGLLVWVFAGTSAWAQYRHGLTVRDTHPDAYWAFPAFALLGPTLLEVTLSRLRRWARQDQGEQATGAAGFGSRWIPGVAFRETLRAWAASRREGIAGWAESVAYVREQAALRGLAGPDSIRYAWQALGHRDVYPARVWLQARGVLVDQAAIDAALSSLPVLTPARPRPPLPAPTAPALPAAAPVSPAPVSAARLDLSSTDYHAGQLAACTSKADKARYALRVLGPDSPTADVTAWLSDHGVQVTRTTIKDARASSGALVDPSGEYPPVAQLVARPRLVTAG